MGCGHRDRYLHAEARSRTWIDWPNLRDLVREARIPDRRRPLVPRDVECEVVSAIPLVLERQRVGDDIAGMRAAYLAGRRQGQRIRWGDRRFDRASRCARTFSRGHPDTVERDLVASHDRIGVLD